MTPEQIDLVRDNVVAIGPRLGELAGALYRRLFTAHPELRVLFTDDPVVQREKFADELDAIVHAISDFAAFAERARGLGSRHAGYGVRTAHYRMFGLALMQTLAAELGDAWTPELAEAWRSAYHLVSEAMMLGVTSNATSPSSTSNQVR